MKHFLLRVSFAKTGFVFTPFRSRFNNISWRAIFHKIVYFPCPSNVGYFLVVPSRNYSRSRYHIIEKKIIFHRRKKAIKKERKTLALFPSARRDKRRKDRLKRKETITIQWLGFIECTFLCSAIAFQ